MGARRIRYLLIIDDDAARAGRLLADATSRGLNSAVAENLTSARRLLGLRTPGTVLLDLALHDGVEAALDLLTETALKRPVLVMTDPDQSVDRVEVARRGGRGFLPHSMTAAAIVDAVVSLRQRLRPVGTRVLAVDDDPVMLAAIRASSDGAGLDLVTSLADVDALTGALNRRKSVEDIERLLRMAARADQPLSLCIMDIDDFKSINDGHGHPAGDAVLRGVAQLCTGSCGAMT